MQLDTKSVTLSVRQHGSLAAAVFDCLTVADGVNGWAVLDFPGIDGELYAVEAEHVDAAVSGTFDVSLLSAFTEADLLSGESCAGLAVNTSHRKRLYDDLTSYARELYVCDKQQFRAKFSTNVATRVRVVIWYKRPAAKV